ncbi:hypothetical protein PSENEW3_00000032 [Picochlorum sp. SENEW3]|nr:hypothetical protein PSENEW3_00000032 [Picochlorum sp. SENEW3]
MCGWWNQFPHVHSNPQRESVSLSLSGSTMHLPAPLAPLQQGVLEGAGFPTIRVTAHFVPQTSTDGKESAGGQKVTLLIKFDPSVLEREAMLSQIE